MTFDRRRYAREYARRRHEREYQERIAGSPERCPFRLGGNAVCGGKLTWDSDGLGNVVAHCAWCERRKRGLCRDCPAPVEGRVRSALRCALHKRLAMRRFSAKHTQNNQRKIRAKARDYSRRPGIRERRNEYKRLVRAAFPSKVAKQKARERKRDNRKRRAYFKRYRREHGNVRYGANGHPCVSCDTRLTGRQKKCERCRLATKELARLALEALLSQERAA